MCRVSLLQETEGLDEIEYEFLDPVALNQRYKKKKKKVTKKLTKCYYLLGLQVLIFFLAETNCKKFYNITRDRIRVNLPLANRKINTTPNI